MLLPSINIFLRSLFKNRLYALLNLGGLIIAFSAISAIWVYVEHETSYEAFHSKSDRIYRATYAYDNQQGFAVHWARVPVDYVNELQDEFPGIEEFIRFQRFGQRYIRIDEKKFRPRHVYTVDSSVFKVFDFDLIRGDPQTALTKPSSIVLTESKAKAYFGSVDVIGKTLQLVGDFDPEGKPFLITGVMKDLPANTHLPVDIFLSFGGSEERRGWAYVYILMKELANIEDLKAGMPDFIARHNDPESAIAVNFEFQQLTDIHLHSNLAREIIPNGNAIYPRLFRFVAIFILLIALFNYINLSSTMAMTRGREMGIRQLLGASRWHLMGFAMGESILLNLIAALGGLGLTVMILPVFEEWIGSQLVFDLSKLVTGIVLTAIVGGFLAGIYPGIVLTGFKPLTILKQQGVGNARRPRSRLSFRKVMLTLQFAASILLVGSSFIAWSQLRFIKNKNLGLNGDQVLALYANQPTVKDEYQSFRNQIRQIPGVKEVAACMEVPSREIRDSGPVSVLGRDEEPDQAPMMDVQVVSPGFVKMLGMELLAGDVGLDREAFLPPAPFSEEYTPEEYLNNRQRNYLINETAMRQLGWETPEEAIGQQISWSISVYKTAYGPITGVIKDFHQESLKNTIDPMVMFFEPIWLNTFLVKLDGTETSALIAEMEEIWNMKFPEFPMEYHFLDELYNRLYQKERIELQLLILFSGLSIFIAFLGLFALIAWSLRIRRKELAIRKVLGSQSWDLINMLIGDFWLLIGLGAIVAIPVSYMVVGDWLENFAYRVEISPGYYLLTLCLVLGLLFGTVGFHVMRATVIKPVEALRDE